jgi:hypothetical protein
MCEVQAGRVCRWEECERACRKGAGHHAADGPPSMLFCLWNLWRAAHTQHKQSSVARSRAHYMQLHMGMKAALTKCKQASQLFLRTHTECSCRWWPGLHARTRYHQASESARKRALNSAADGGQGCSHRPANHAHATREVLARSEFTL